MTARHLTPAAALISISLLVLAGCAGLTAAGKADHFVYSNSATSEVLIYDARDGVSRAVKSPAGFGDLRSDGDLVAYADSSQIFTCKPDGADVLQLTTSGGFNTRPVFSHDGTKILFYSTRDGNPEIYVMNADGTAQTRLTNDPGDDAQASFSPDDSKIIWHSNRDGDYEIYTMNADGTGLTKRTNNAVDDFCATFVPDMSGFIYCSMATGNGDLYRFEFTGGTSTFLYGTATDTEAFPTVGPLQDRIYFVQRLAGGDNVCETDINGNNFRVLLDIADPKSVYITSGTTIARY